MNDEMIDFPEGAISNTRSYTDSRTFYRKYEFIIDL